MSRKGCWKLCAFTIDSYQCPGHFCCSTCPEDELRNDLDKLPVPLLWALVTTRATWNFHRNDGLGAFLVEHTLANREMADNILKVLNLGREE